MTHYVKPQETHYTPKDVAELWKISVDTVRRIFSEESGVIRIECRPGRNYATLRIPQSVLERVHRRMSVSR